MPHAIFTRPGARKRVAMNAPQRTLEPLLATTFPHPTLSEAVKVAARDG
jgi:pyruvate/2-oxoglutarate dehydrogenase complex dihydrolipoamide dehydrogenase (E3) component